VDPDFRHSRCQSATSSIRQSASVASTPPLRPIGDGDLPALLALNNANAPQVGHVDAPHLARLVGWAWAAVTTPDLAAFAIVLPPGLPYGSPNYRWFDARYRDYAYIDRIAVAETARRRGLGRLIYGAVVERALAEGVGRLLCEVNVRPPNPGSVAFHERLGFRRTGVRSDGPAGVTVAMMARRVAGTTPPGRPPRP
jgi:uncharacterized protein